MASGQALTTWGVYRDINPGVTGVLVKANPGDVGGWYLYNAAATARYLKLYDKATVPTSADVPKLTIPIPSVNGANIINGSGIDFTVGIGYRVTTGVADNDTGAPSANDVTLNLLYR